MNNAPVPKAALMQGVVSGMASNGKPCELKGTARGFGSSLNQYMMDTFCHSPTI